MIDYVAIVISSSQLPKGKLSKGPHFIVIPVGDLPLHYKIGNGKKLNEPEWDKKEYSDVIYPNIKLKLKETKSGIEFVPDLASYNQNIIAKNSPFRKAGSYRLDTLPNKFHN